MESLFPGLKGFSRFMERDFSLLFTSLMLMLLAYPLLEHHKFGLIGLDVLLGIVLLSGVRAVASDRPIFRILVFLSIFCLPGLIILHFRRILLLQIIVIVLSGLFLAFTAFTVLIHMLSGKKVTADHIIGAACVYILIGVIWAHIYSFLELTAPGSISMNLNPGLLHDGTQIPQYNMYDFLYFSYVTLATVGYGDIVPISTLAKAFANMEAIIGQLYIAVLVARLVGIHITQGRVVSSVETTDEVEKGK